MPRLRGPVLNVLVLCVLGIAVLFVGQLQGTVVNLRFSSWRPAADDVVGQPPPPSNQVHITPSPTILSTSRPTVGRRPSLYQRAQACLRDSPFVPNPLPLVLTEATTPMIGAAVLEAHYQEMLAATTELRTIPVHEYAGYKGPWLENYWINEFCCEKKISSFGGLVPLFIQWTDMTISWGIGWPGRDAARLFMSKLRRDVIYVTVSQHDNGIGPMQQSDFQPDFTWNILVMSAGGVGHIPIPLLINEQPVASVPIDAPHLFAFAGTMHQFSTVRSSMRSVLEEESMRFGFSYHIYPGGPEWASIMKRAKLNLAPRGYGRTSFRLYEIIQMGLVPVHIWDDVEWIPYKGSVADISRFGFSLHINEFQSWVQSLCNGLQKDASYLRMSKRRETILSLRNDYFTLPGTMKQIALFLEDSPNNVLVCQRHPPKNK